MVPHPISREGCHFQYWTVSIRPRPLRQPYPPTYALGTSRESCEFAARHYLGLGVSFGPFEVVSKATRYNREQCALHGWEPSPQQIIYRANILLAESDAEAQEALQRRQQHPEVPFPMRPGVRDALMRRDFRNLAEVPRPDFQSGALPTTFVGSPDTVMKQVERRREEVGAGVIDLCFQSSDAEGPQGVR
jgi:alkanesulfonate monooxygenase SsuD/methylene tetrahydromethanopterin reductase-like flavin-dependent oxidoreductase (luciferase family)